MITSLFKNTLLSYLIIILTAIGLWGFAFFTTHPSAIVSIDFANESYHLSKKAAIIISFFATLISAFFLNYRVNKFLFSYEPNNLFLWFYLLFFSVELSNSSFLMYDVVSFLLIIFVYYLLSFISSKESKNHVFNSAFIIGVLCFHNVFFALFLLLLIHNLSTTRRVGISELMLILTGFAIPILLVFSLSILTDNDKLIGTLWDVQFTSPDISWKFAVFIIAAFLFALIGFQLASNKRSGTDISVLLLVNNLFVYLLISLAVSVFSIFLQPQHYILFLFTLPLSIFLSFFFSESTSKWKELAFVAVIALTFLLR
jgi:hypothetical protein